MIEIFITLGPDDEFRTAVPLGEYTIGRDPSADIVVNHPTISRRHARLVVDEQDVVLIDLGSGNGTSIEEVPLSGPARLYEGQTARLGDALLRARRALDLESLPDTSGNYRKGPVAAQGGMGAIHEARQRAMGRKVAMKVMLRENSAGGMRRFINEARITGMLEHPNIVPVHEVGVDAEGRVFYTMKFVGGTTLAEALSALRAKAPGAARQYSLPVLLTIFQKACDAIAFAHNRGVRHRDIKPENVMIGDFGEVLVLDWGLAKERGFGGAGDSMDDESEGESPGPALRTIEGCVLGTPAYMSPEQARGEVGAMDERSDTYALGAVLHEILYLQPPVSGDSPAEILQKVAYGSPDPLPKRGGAHLPGCRVPPSLEAVRRKALARDPGQRYQQVKDLQADIAAYQSGFATAAEGAGLATHLWLLIKRNRGVSAAILAGFALLAVATLLFTGSLMHALRKTQDALARAEESARKEQLAADARIEALEMAKQAEQQAGHAAKLAERSQSEAEAASQEAARKASEAEAANSRASAAEADKAATAAATAKKFAATAEAMVRQGDLAHAMDNIESAIRLAPASAAYLTLRANLLQSSRRFDEAAAAYRAALDVGGDARAEENLRLSEDFSARRGADGAIPFDVMQDLGAALREQGRNDELRFLEMTEQEASGETSLAEPSAGDENLRRALAEFVSQPGWNEGRVSAFPGGGIRLDLSGLDVRSLEILRPLDVRSLDLRGTQASDLSPLYDMLLEELSVAANTGDLSQLMVRRLRSLDLNGSAVSDLGPLAGAPLENLWMDGAPVESLEPLRGMPLKALHANAPRIKDFSVIGTLAKLQELSLPARAAGVPVAGLGALDKVWHPRFQAEGWMPGAVFRILSARSDEAWEKWGDALKKLGAADLGPHRVTVVKEASDPQPLPDTFDLDLRGTGASDLSALRGIPLHRLYLDTARWPVDLTPLAKHRWLQHLVLAGANTPTLQGVLDSPALKSIVLSTETADVSRLLKHPSLRWAGYKADPSTRLPTTSVKDLFADRLKFPDSLRHPLSGRKPLPPFLFDNAKEGESGWKLSPAETTATGMVWRPDPPKEGGRGGGYIEFFQRGANAAPSYFSVPKNFFTREATLYGCSLSFDLRAEGDGVPADCEIVVKSPFRSLYCTLAGKQPSPEWRNFVVAFRESEGWTNGSPQGPPATAEDLRTILSKVSEVLIRADYYKSAKYQQTGLDDVALWDPGETTIRYGRPQRQEFYRPQ